MAKKPAIPVGANLTRAASRAPGKAGVPQEFQPDYRYVRADLRRIAVLAVAFLSLLVILSFLIG